MQAGVCGVVNGEFDRVHGFTTAITENGHELMRSIEIDRIFSLSTGSMGFEGTAAVERLTTQAETTIVDGDIQVTETEVKETVTARFAGVPGELVVTESGAAAFVLELLGRETGAEIERAEIDLSAFLEEHRDGSPWKAGFYDRGGKAEKGTLYGEDLLSDESVAPVLTEAALNQLGIDYEYRDSAAKVDLTESGYVRVHRPNDLEVTAFLEFILAEVQPHFRSA